VGEEAAWVQMDPKELAFEALDQFLGLAPERHPYVLVHLTSIWVDGEGVPKDLRVEIERSALRAFRLCTRPDEWIHAWEAKEEYSDWLYRFWPHRATEPVDWNVSFYPYHDMTQLFVSQAFDWGIYAAGSSEADEWDLTVFGKPLLDAFTGHWPSGWSKIVRTRGSDDAPGT
jgi:hypothetical protein